MSIRRVIAMMRPEFDLEAFGAEFAVMIPGLAEQFEPDNPGMHRTDSRLRRLRPRQDHG